MFNKSSAFFLGDHSQLIPCFLYGDGLKYTHTSLHDASRCYKFYIVNSDLVLLVYGDDIFNLGSEPIFLSAGHVSSWFNSLDDMMNFIIETFCSVDSPYEIPVSIIGSQNNSLSDVGILSFRVYAYFLAPCCPLDYLPIVKLLGGQ